MFEQHILGAFTEGSEELICGGQIQFENNTILSISNLRQCRDSIRNNCSIAVEHEVSKLFDKAPLLGSARISRVEFRDADGRRFPYIWIAILETVSQVLIQSVRDHRNGNIGHGPDRQGADERVSIIAVLTLSDSFLD